jgi:tetratricopeptide (TPR) repeat protein
LFNVDSEIHTQLSEEIDFVYVADRLSKTYAADLAVALTETLDQRRHPDAPINVARVLQERGQTPQADQMLLRALADRPDDPKASYSLLRIRRGDVLAGDLPERISGYVANLTPAAAAVIAAWDASMAGNPDAAREADAALATASPQDQWYLDATKLRADWRIKAVTSGEDKKLAEEAMAIIDSAIALYKDLDIYGMRLAAAYLAEDYDGLIETARRMIQVIRSDIDFRLDSSSSTIRRAALQRHARRVQSIREGVATVREGQKVAAYKVGNLDAEIIYLLKKIEHAIAVSK